ncbi:MAG: MliC family protein [Stenotrophomonas sp.]|uniref:MliC family protein n=1 Tax=Stenotrophomonas sp. TaxID=69392 RepID=UPI003D6D8A2C
MRASPLILSVAIVIGLAACQPAQQAEGAAPGASPAGDEAPPPAAAPTSDERVYAFQCGDLAVRATYRGQDSATVVVGDRTFVMANETAASGAKYGDGQGNTFWTKGTTEGTLTLKGEPDRACTGSGKEGEVAAATADTAPAFRATGNEPGWLAQVSAGPHPQLRVETGYGEQKFEVTAPTQGKDGWSGKAADGTDINVSFQRTVCEDNMSGQKFGATVMLTVGTRQYHGCGDFAGAPSLAARP